MAREQVGRVIVELDEDACWRHLDDEVLGRLAVSVDGRLHLVPVTYSVVDRTVVIRTIGGTKLQSALSQPGREAVFEIDGVDEADRLGWSVVVVGALEPVLDQVTVAALDRGASPSWLMSDTGGTWVRLVPRRLTGRRLEPAG